MIVIVYYNNTIAGAEGRFALAVFIIVAIKDVVIQWLADEVGICLIICRIVPAEHCVGCSNNITVAKFFGFLSLC